MLINTLLTLVVVTSSKR